MIDRRDTCEEGDGARSQTFISIIMPVISDLRKRRLFSSIVLIRMLIRSPSLAQSPEGAQPALLSGPNQSRFQQP